MSMLLILNLNLKAYKGLQKSKEIGNTYKEVDTERDNVLAVLDELMPVYKELKSYTDSKAYLNDGKAKGNESS